MKISRIAFFNFISKYALVFILFALIIFFHFNSPFFLQAANAINIARQVAIIGVCAVGMTFVILTGGIDLSTGSIVGVSAAIAARLMFMAHEVPESAFWAFLAPGLSHPVVATIIPILLGVVLGLINGFFINVITLPPLITTLGTMTALRGVAKILVDGRGVTVRNRAYSVIGQGYVFEDWLGPVIPVPVVIMVCAFIFGYIVLEKTKLGRYIYGIGDNEEATRLSGVNVKKTRYAVYAFSGFLCALAGTVSVSRLMSAQPTTGEGYELQIITAVVLGGVSIKGGEGKIAFVIVGVFIMGVLANGMIMMNISAFWQDVVRGCVLLLAVTYDRLMDMRRQKMQSRA